MKISLVPNREHLKRLREIGGPELRRTFAMDDPALLRRLGAAHRAQETRVFASEGAEGSQGKWPALNARYALRKAKAVGRRKILVLTGDTKAAFTKFGAPGYIERYVPTSEAHGVFQFGAASAVGAAHRAGNPLLAGSPSATARKVFGGRARNLPVRDPNPPKTEGQLAQMREALRTWCIARMKAMIRARGRLGLA